MLSASRVMCTFSEEMSHIFQGSNFPGSLGSRGEREFTMLRVSSMTKPVCWLDGFASCNFS